MTEERRPRFRAVRPEGPTEAEIERSQARIAAILGPEEVEKIGKEADEIEIALEAKTAATMAALTPTADPSPPLTEADLPPEPAAPPDWNPMDTARKDGRNVWLTDGNGHTCEAAWRTSRRYSMKKENGRWIGKFRPVSYWAVANGGGQRVPFEPKGWRSTTGAPHP